MQPVLKPHFSLVIPVYRNAGSIHDLVRAVARLDAGLDGRLEVIFVVDGSPDDSHERLRNELPASGLDAKLILLSRNFGSFAAIREGREQNESVVDVMPCYRIVYKLDRELDA